MFVTKMRASLAEIFSERLQTLAYALESPQIAESRVFTDGFVPVLSPRNWLIPSPGGFSREDPTLPGK
jgi:hypothetical protein